MTRTIWSPSGRLSRVQMIAALAVAFFAASGCQQSVEVSLESVDIITVDQHPDRNLDPEYWDQFEEDGLTAVSFTASADLNALVQENDYAFPYFTLFNCRLGEEARNHSGSPANFTMKLRRGDPTTDSDTDAMRHSYVAIFPRNLAEALGISHPADATDSWAYGAANDDGVCLKVGAGNMTGGHLSSNTLDLSEYDPVVFR